MDVQQLYRLHLENASGCSARLVLAEGGGTLVGRWIREGGRFFLERVAGEEGWASVLDLHRAVGTIYVDAETGVHRAPAFVIARDGRLEIRPAGRIELIHRRDYVRVPIYIPIEGRREVQPDWKVRLRALAAGEASPSGGVDPAVEGAPFQGESTDLSPAGLAFVPYDPKGVRLSQGDRLRIRFLADGWKDLGELGGTVIRAAGQGFGVRFDPLPDRTHRRMVHLLAVYHRQGRG